MDWGDFLRAYSSAGSLLSWVFDPDSGPLGLGEGVEALDAVAWGVGGSCRGSARSFGRIARHPIKGRAGDFSCCPGATVFCSGQRYRAFYFTEVAASEGPARVRARRI